MAEPIIKVNNLQVVYNEGTSSETVSLKNINLKFWPGEYIIIFGPSGCGKSTLLYSIAGLQKPTDGEVIIGGKNLAEGKAKDTLELHRKTVGMIFQAFYLIPSLTIIENVCLPKTFVGEERKKRKEEGMKLLRRFGISEHAHKFPNQLSGGQKQRVAIARALINDAQIILADEPVGNLDSESARNVLKILKELNEIDKKTVILVTHNSEHIYFADRVVYMRDGGVVTEEFNKDKRPREMVVEEMAQQPKEITPELSLLIRTFRNFSPQQVGGLIVPYKSKQLLTHIISELTEEQMRSAESFVKDLLYRNISLDDFKKNLDTDIDEGGAGWNKKRSETFANRLQGIIEQAENISLNRPKASQYMAEYLAKVFKLKLNPEIMYRFQAFLRLRLENKIDAFALKERLDSPIDVGGVGLYKNTVSKIINEVEIILLVKYSGEDAGAKKPHEIL
jgi:putative ABC transport system ATP-binding protein